MKEDHKYSNSCQTFLRNAYGNAYGILGVKCILVFFSDSAHF